MNGLVHVIIISRITKLYVGIVQKKKIKYFILLHFTLHTVG